MTVQKIIDCPHCGKPFELCRETKECSNCFGCVGCEQYVCPHCKTLVVIEPPKYKRKDTK